MFVSIKPFKDEVCLSALVSHSSLMSTCGLCGEDASILFHLMMVPREVDVTCILLTLTVNGLLTEGRTALSVP